jgi:hypothetical protein
MAKVKLNNIHYTLTKTTNRLTFDITWQNKMCRHLGDDDSWVAFVANNGYEIISRSRMDIQTERLWLLGGQANERSGTMVFSSEIKRDTAFREFTEALLQWDAFAMRLFSGRMSHGGDYANFEGLHKDIACQNARGAHAAKT